MRASEYVERVTAYIADSARALEVRRELEEHLNEAIAELQAQGIDPETAELVAVARMGPPENVALDLAETHHRHLPWRHYLAVVPLLVLLFTELMMGRSETVQVAPFWLVVLAGCMVPPWATLVSFWVRLRLDMIAKYRWLRSQPRYGPVTAGITAGGLGGALFAAGFLMIETTGLVSGVLLVVILPLVVSVGALILFRPQAPAVQAAGVAAVAFPVLCLSAMSTVGKTQAVAAGLSISGGYAMLLFVAGWLIDRVAARRNLVRT